MVVRDEVSLALHRGSRRRFLESSCLNISSLQWYGRFVGGCLKGPSERLSHRSPFLPASKGWFSCLCALRWVQRFAKGCDRIIIFFALQSRERIDWRLELIIFNLIEAVHTFFTRLLVARHPKLGPECLSNNDPSSMEYSDGFSAMGRVRGACSSACG